LRKIFENFSLFTLIAHIHRPAGNLSSAPKAQTYVLEWVALIPKPLPLSRIFAHPVSDLLHSLSRLHEYFPFPLFPETAFRPGCPVRGEGAHGKTSTGASVDPGENRKI
jgi:hypothetical protein